MQNEQGTQTTAQAYQQKQIKNGKYEFYVKDIIREDSNGYQLKIQTGNNIGQVYRKFRLIVVDGEDIHTIDKLIFSRKDVKEIVLAINNPALTHVYNQQGDKFEDENLIGESGLVLIGKRFNESDGKSYPKIECFIKPKADFPNLVSAPIGRPEKVAPVNPELLDDGVPF